MIYNSKQVQRAWGLIIARSCRSLLCDDLWILCTILITLTMTCQGFGKNT